MKQEMNFKLDQKLVMTPQLQLAIKLLQMPVQDLQEFISKEMLDNPFLSGEDGTAERESAAESKKKDEDTFTEIDSEKLGNKEADMDCSWENMYDSGRGSSGSAPLDDDLSWENTATKEQTLKEVLDEQLGLSTDDPALRFLGHYLIDEIDDSGYLNVELSEISSRLGVPEKKVEEALMLIQKFEPAGVGARSLQECLELQLYTQEEITTKEQKIAANVLTHLDLLAQRDLSKLAKLAKVTLEEIARAVEIITSLTPKPGLKYGTDVSSTVIPDVVVSKGEEGWKAELNAEAMPKVLLSRNQNHFLSHAKGEEKNYMNERVSRAQWLIKSLEQRARTIHRVANAIVKAQEDFFEQGIESLQPLTLKNVAEKVEVHESTVSRVTNGKYMQTPIGVFELKYFFSSAINTTGGNMSVASQSVKQMIKRLIGEETATKPLSDEKLVSLLQDEGVDVARRTVAKYREALNIPSSSKRRVKG